MNFMENGSSLSPPLGELDSPTMGSDIHGVHSSQATHASPIPAHASPTPTHASPAPAGAANEVGMSKQVGVSTASSLSMFQLGSPHHPVGEPLFLLASTPATSTTAAAASSSPTSTHAKRSTPAKGRGLKVNGISNAEFNGSREQPSSTSGLPEQPSSTVTVKTERKGYII